MVKKIQNNQMQELLESKLALVDFSATWCGPCQMLAPVVDELAEEMAGELDVFSVDVDENGSLAEKFNIMSVPTLILFRDGEKVAQTAGFQPKESIVDFVKGN